MLVGHVHGVEFDGYVVDCRSDQLSKQTRAGKEKSGHLNTRGFFLLNSSSGRWYIRKQQPPDRQPLARSNFSHPPYKIYRSHASTPCFFVAPRRLWAEPKGCYEVRKRESTQRVSNTDFCARVMAHRGRSIMCICASKPRFINRGEPNQSRPLDEAPAISLVLVFVRLQMLEPRLQTCR